MAYILDIYSMCNLGVFKSHLIFVERQCLGNTLFITRFRTSCEMFYTHEADGIECCC